jgi:prolipoprotein diacylglyceryltransferase
VFERVDRVTRHPVQLYEGIWYLVLTAALLLLRPRWQSRAGVLSGLFLVGMFVPRFFLEFTKDSPVIFAGLNTGQALSLPFVAVGALILFPVGMACAGGCQRGGPGYAGHRRRAARIAGPLEGSSRQVTRLRA